MRWFKRRPISPQYATPTEAVQFIASICDGAVARDGLGFQKEHVAIGHAMASTDPATWESWQHDWAMYFVRYYRRQLTEAGFDVDQILKRRPQERRRVSVGGDREQWEWDPYGFAARRLWNGARWTGRTSHDSGPRPVLTLRALES